MRQSGAETLVTEEPYELIAHVRICGGAGWVTTGSTRKPISQEKLPLYLGFFECVHNVRKRGKALLPALLELLVT